MTEVATYVGKTLKCQDCRGEFAWSAEEQQFYAKKDYVAPKRCAPCRKRRREAKRLAKT